jgi:hypothetical protein
MPSSWRASEAKGCCEIGFSSFVLLLLLMLVLLLEWRVVRQHPLAKTLTSQRLLVDPLKEKRLDLADRNALLLH